MRKKTVNHVADTIFWYLIYFLPVIAFLLYMLAEPASGLGTVATFENFLTTIGFSFVTDNIVYTTLSSLFGVGGVLPLFSTSAPIFIFTWFVSVFICHLAVDFLLFIPRLAHKYMKKFTQGE